MTAATCTCNCTCGAQAPQEAPQTDNSAFVPGSHMAAAMGLTAFPVIASKAFRDREYRASTEGADPDLLRFAQAFTRDLKKRGYPFYIHTITRSKADQEAAFAKGVSKARFGQSPHNFGKAADIVHFGKGWNLTKKEWDVLGLIGKEVARRLNLKVTWGGDWKFYDPAHWELTDWKKAK